MSRTSIKTDCPSDSSSVNRIRNHVLDGQESTKFKHLFDDCPLITMRKRTLPTGELEIATRSKTPPSIRQRRTIGDFGITRRVRQRRAGFGCSVTGRCHFNPLGMAAYHTVPQISQIFNKRLHRFICGNQLQSALICVSDNLCLFYKLLPSYLLL